MRKSNSLVIIALFLTLSFSSCISKVDYWEQYICVCTNRDSILTNSHFISTKTRAEAKEQCEKDNPPSSVTTGTYCELQ